MLKKVEPLREELNSLENQAETNKRRGDEVKTLITQLEHSISSYKEEYAQLIAQAQAIKSDLENVQAKVDRSIALIKSLVIERTRWEATSETFRSQMSTIIGDVLLSSAFIAYGGYFDQHVSYMSFLHKNNLLICTHLSSIVKTYLRHGVNICLKLAFNIVQILQEQSIYQILMNVYVGKQMLYHLMICAQRTPSC